MEAGTSRDNAYQGNGDGDISQQNIEIKIKTLDSHVYTCQVDKNVPVPALKEQIALLTGVPVENQRLICRGKVLKDDHLLSAYGIEDGHTLHLVTRHAQEANPTSASGVSRNEAAAEDEGLQPGASHNRAGQVSHSVMLGTFNIPDHGDGGMTEVGRIIGSVLNSIGLSNLVPVNGGANNSSSVAATILPGRNLQQPGTEDQRRVEASDTRPQIGANLGHPLTSLVEEPQFDSVHGLRPGGGFIGAIPTAAPQLRFVQQAMVVPDALTTLSQYLNRLEQAFGSNGQQPSLTVPSLSTQTRSPAVSVTAEQQLSGRGYPTPAALGTLLHRVQEFLSNQAMPELATLSSRLQNEPSLHDVAARGEVQSTTLRDGIMMQHLGALLLELGRATLTLRMGSSPAESAINTGPAMFISASGPNPMMVQPLPFQPSIGVGALTPQPSNAAMVPPVGASEAPRNVNIHIHAGDLGLPSIFPAVPQASPVAPQLGGGPYSSQGQNSDASNTTSSGGNIPTMLANSSSIQGGSISSGEQGSVRVLPMRTLVAAVPAVLHNRPPIEATATTVGVFYPLLARFQQLNQAQLSQQTTLVNGSSMEQPVLLGTSASSQQQSFVSAPTVRAQVQLQAWVPASGHMGDVQAVTRPANMECTVQLPSTSLASEGPSLVPQQEQSQSAGTESMADRQSVPSQPSPVELSNVEIPVVSSNNYLQAATGQAEHGGEAAEGMVIDTDVTGLGRTTMQQAVGACQQSGAGIVDLPQSEQIASANVAIREDVQKVMEDAHKPDEDVKLHLNTQDMNDAEQSKQRSEKNKGACCSEGIGMQRSPVLAASSNSREFSKEGDNLKIQKNGVTNVPVGLGPGGLQPIPSRVQKRSHKQSPQHHVTETGKYSQEAVEQDTQAISSEGECVATLTKGTGSLQDSSSSLSSPLEHTVAGGTTGQIPERLAQFLNRVGSTGHTLGGQNCNVGELVPQLVTTQSLGNISRTAIGATTQGTSLSSASLGSMMGQIMQSPFMGNVLQQVMGQMGNEPQAFDNMLNGQGGFDLSGMLQQMMPIVSQAFSRATGGISDLATNPTPQMEHRSQEDAGATQDAGLINALDCQKHFPNKDELAQQNQTISTDIEQEQVTLTQMPGSDAYSQGAPVTKRQKMDLEETVKKLEHGDLPGEILRSIAEAASNLIAPMQSAELNVSELAQRLSETDGLANEYMSMLFQDLSARVMTDPEISDSSDLPHILKVFEQL